MNDNNKPKRLWLHEELMKIVHALGSEAAPDDDDTEDKVLDPMWIYSVRMPDADIFDCRALPLNFVLDTGESYLEEPPDQRGPVVLPSPVCYFEFGDRLGILAMTADGVTDEDDKEVKVFAFPIRYAVFQGASGTDPFVSEGSFANEAHEDALTFLNKNRGQQEIAARGGALIVGILNLMRDRFVNDRFVPDPKPWITKTRRQKGKYPISGDTRIITVSVPALRAASQQHDGLGTHESPMLHWRRGHWRTLHRGGDNEKRAWVKRCLVGDPDKGFVSHRHFRLVPSPILSQLTSGATL